MPAYPHFVLRLEAEPVSSQLIDGRGTIKIVWHLVSGCVFSRIPCKGGYLPRMCCGYLSDGAVRSENIGKS